MSDDQFTKLFNEIAKASPRLDAIEENMATKGEIKATKDYIDQRFTEQGERLDKRFTQQEERLNKRLLASEQLIRDELHQGFEQFNTLHEELKGDMNMLSTQLDGIGAR